MSVSTINSKTCKAGGGECRIKTVWSAEWNSCFCHEFFFRVYNIKEKTKHAWLPLSCFCHLYLEDSHHPWHLSYTFLCVRTLLLSLLFYSRSGTDALMLLGSFGSSVCMFYSFYLNTVTFKWPNAECLSFELVFDITHLSSFQSHRKCFFSKAALHKVSSGSGWGIGHELSLSLQTQHFYCHEGRSFISVLLSFLSVITINHPTWLVSSVFSSLSANDSPVRSVQLPFFLLQDCLFL